MQRTARSSRIERPFAGTRVAVQAHALKYFAIVGLLVSADAFAQAPPDAGAPPPDAQPAEQPAPPPDQPEHPPPAQGAPIKVTGRVIDKFGKPVRDAKVGLEGNDERVKTDRGGRFTLL